ncbi:MAG: hypothetical protein ACF8R7_01665 [Phycisphaerales bacterium JB039]
MKKMGMGAAAVLLMGAGVASADVLEFNLNRVFSGTQASGYVNVKLTQVGNDVELVLTSFLAAGEFVDGTTPSRQGNQGGIFLNFNPAKDISKLAISSATVVSGQFTASTHAISTDAYQADGDGLYDIRIDFGNPAGQRFDGSDVAKFTFTFGTALESIAAADFKFDSSPGPGTSSGPFLAAGHIQGIGPSADDSGFHSPTLVPLPQPVWYGLAGLGLAGAVSIIKRRR